MPKTALLIVDVQNDFLPKGEHRPHGSMAVPDGDQVIPVITQLLDADAGWDWDLVIATQDYHPPGHISFASRHSREPYTALTVTDARGKTYEQALWPDHCVQGTKGAEIDSGLRRTFESWKGKMKLVRKACQCDIEAYSAFEGYVTEATDPAEPTEQVTEGEMADLLRRAGVGKVVITGLATDFCVKETALDSLKSGFHTALLVPSVRGVFEAGSKQALDEVERQGGVSIGEEGADWAGELKEWIGDDASTA